MRNRWCIVLAGLLIGGCGGPGDDVVEETVRRSLEQQAAGAGSDMRAAIAKADLQNQGCETHPAVPGVQLCRVAATLDLPGRGTVEQEIPVAMVRKSDGSWIDMEDCRPGIDSAADC